MGFKDAMRDAPSVDQQRSTEVETESLGDQVKSFAQRWADASEVIGYGPERSVLAAGQGTLEGLTLGASTPVIRNVGGAAMAVGSRLTSDEPMSFDEAVRMISQEQAALREEHPISTIAGNVAGGVATGTKLADLAKTGTDTFAKRVLGSAALGAAENVGITAGRADPSDLSMRDLAMQGVIGAGLGAGGQSLAEGIGQAMRPITERALPMVGVNKFAREEGERRAAKSLLDAAPEQAPLLGPVPVASELDLPAGKSIMEAIEVLPKGQIVGDVPGMAPVVARTASSPATAGMTRPLRELAEQRITSAPSRFDDALVTSMGPDKSTGAFSKEIMDRRSEYADLYARVFADAEDAGVKTTLKELNKSLDEAFAGIPPIEGRAVFDKFRKHVAKQDFAPKGKVTPEALLSLKKDLDQAISATGDRAVDYATKSRLIDAKNGINDMLGDLVPGYKEVAAKYADDASMLSSYTTGKELFKDRKVDADALKNAYGKFRTAAEKRHFMQGVMAQLSESATGNPSYYRRTFGNRTTIERQKLETLFGEGPVDELVNTVQRISEETASASLWSTALGGRQAPADPGVMPLASIAAATQTAARPGGMASATEFGLLRNLGQKLSAPEVATTQNLIDVFQKPKEEALRTLLDMSAREQARRSSTLLPGGAAAIVGTNLLDE